MNDNICACLKNGEILDARGAAFPLSATDQLCSLLSSTWDSEVSCDVGEAPPPTAQLTGSIETPYSRPASSSHIQR